MRLLPLGFGLAVAVNTAAQTPPSPPPAAADQPVFRTGTTVVLLDVVIRDKKGRPIPDVTRDEVEVFEEGVRQKIEAFRWVETEAPIEAMMGMMWSNLGSQAGAWWVKSMSASLATFSNQNP